jgi:hypothetical protein
MASKFARDQARETEQRRDAQVMPVQGIVTASIPESECLRVEQFNNPGAFTMSTVHPFIGVNTWIRVSPDPGTACLIQQRGDLAQSEILGYISADQGRRITRGQDGTAVYRQLATGEIEVMSSGRAYLHFGRDGTLAMLGGVVRARLSQQELENSSVAPTHVRQLHLASPTAVLHQERFGYCKRPDVTKPAGLQRYIKQQDGTYCMEYSRWLGTKAGAALVSVQEGHVVDEAGTIVQGAAAGRPLRYLRVITDASGNAALRIEIDDALNYTVTNTATSATTTSFAAGTLGDVKATGRGWTTDYTQAVSLSAGTTALLKAGVKATIQAPLVELGQGARQPVVLAPGLSGSVLTPTLGAVQAVLAALVAVNTAVQLDPGITVAKPAFAALAGVVANAITVLTSAQGAVANIASTTVTASP